MASSTYDSDILAWANEQARLLRQPLLPTSTRPGEDLTMAHSTMLHVRVDDEIKTQASEALAAMGLSVSDAVRILLKRVVNDQAFPLELKVPNAQTRAGDGRSPRHDQGPRDPF
jgi:addiction module RelB/DinJ family antitoxin